jgi:ferredoxin-NADP reductase
MQTEVYTTELLERHWLSDKTFEAVLSRPAGFEFTPGQRIRLLNQSLERDYSLVNGTADMHLVLCVRNVSGGEFSPLLATAAIGTRFELTGPHGYFVYRKSTRCPVFVATGTGIAPFAALARSGVSGYLLLHGVRQEKDLYYASVLRPKARRYVACLTEDPSSTAGSFCGRVSDYLATQLESDAYDFYLCGREEMIRDVTWLVDDHFPGSLVYTEIFY